jgi:tRNA A-37 threonylcarbamoyl transferase component Bud32
MNTSRCSIKTPFSLRVASDVRQTEMECGRILRYLPGKRLVCAGVWNGQQVVVKIFLHKNKGQIHCQRDVQGIAALHNAGVHAPALLFQGITCPDNQPVLVLECIQGKDLKWVWEQEEDTNTQLNLIESLVLSVADMHSAGLYHHDMHLGNFILADNSLYVIDGGGIEVKVSHGPLPETLSIQNLAMLFAQFPVLPEYMVEHPFQKYLQRRGWSLKRAINDTLAQHIASEQKKRVKRHLHKIYRESTANARCKSASRFWVCSRPYLTEAMYHFLHQPDNYMIAGQLLKNGNSSTVSLVQIDERYLVVKRYNIKGIVHRIKRSARPSRAWISWANAHVLRLFGIHTPEPIALIEKRIGPFRSSAYFITEYVPGSTVYQQMHSKDIDRCSQQKIVRAFKEMLDKFHKVSINHGDLKATNFIVSAGQIVVTDLDAMRLYKNNGKRFTKKFKKDCDRFIKNWSDLPHIHQFSTQLFFHRDGTVQCENENAL